MSGVWWFFGALAALAVLCTGVTFTVAAVIAWRIDRGFRR